MKYLMEKMLDEGMFDRAAARVASVLTRNDQIKSRLNLNAIRDKLEELRLRAINLRKSGKEAEASKLEAKIGKLRKRWIDASNTVNSSDTKDNVKSRLLKSVANDKAISRTKLAKKGIIGTGAVGATTVTAVGINKNKKAKQNQEKEVVNESAQYLIGVATSAALGGGVGNFSASRSTQTNERIVRNLNKVISQCEDDECRDKINEVIYKYEQKIKDSKGSTNRRTIAGAATMNPIAPALYHYYDKGKKKKDIKRLNKDIYYNLKEKCSKLKGEEYNKCREKLNKMWEALKHKNIMT